MHLDILSDNQVDLLPLLSLFKREYCLVGGTAIALQIGHRQSIDFDLFKEKSIRQHDVFKKIDSTAFQYYTTLSNFEQINLIINQVKVTFYQYPFPLEKKVSLKQVIKMPDLLTLAAMKAFALGRRAKWKDYVDLYFLIKNYYTPQDIAEKAKSIFKQQFVEKQFYAQLGYFKFINYEEEVIFKIENPPTQQGIKTYLREVSIGGLN